MRIALIVIAMQQGLFATPKHDAAGTVARINKLAERMRAVGGIVIWYNIKDWTVTPSIPMRPDGGSCPNFVRRTPISSCAKQVATLFWIPTWPTSLLPQRLTG